MVKNKNHSSRNPIQDIDDLFEKERDRIRKRREIAKLPPGDIQKDAVGLGLSGGGVRSATFNLGFLQAMEHYGVRRRVDYLSTVSGGGYIGSSLTWFLSQTNRFPFGTSRGDHAKIGGKILAWIRQHASYLTPDRKFDGWVLAAAGLKGIAINLVILVPLFFTAMYLVISTHVSQPVYFSAWQNNIFPWVFVAGIFSLGLLALGYLAYACCSNFKLVYGFRFRQFGSRTLGLLLKIGVVLMIVGSISRVAMYFIIGDLADIALNKFPLDANMAAASVSVSGVITFAISWAVRNFKNIRIKKAREMMIMLALGLVIYGLFIWMYVGAFMVYSGLDPTLSVLISVGLPISILLGFTANINHVSMHRYYRDRLVSAFLPFPEICPQLKDDPDFAKISNPDSFYFPDIPESSAPYHIVNTAITTIDSKQPTFHKRGVDNFIFSQEVCGSTATGFIATKGYLGGKIDLGTAFTISGAAIDPNTGISRSRPLALLMALFNIRLGYWIRNPAKPRRFLSASARPIWHLYMICEMFGLDIDENRRYIHLSDGGHFENLGLYELVRRQCRYVLISDAGADPNWTYEDLANVCEKVRVDFGADIVIDTQPLHPDKETGISNSAFVTGKIHYVNGDIGQIIYVKSTMIKRLPEDIYGYKRAHDNFPDEPTADQFFTEQQFEAYRELGYQIGKSVFRRYHGSLENIFSDEAKQVKKVNVEVPTKKEAVRENEELLFT